MAHMETFSSRDEYWQTPHWIAHEDDAIRVLQFCVGQGPAVLVVPPQAGHHSYIADFGPGQSLVECAMQATDAPVYAIEWKSCSWERRDEGIEDLLGHMAKAVSVVGLGCHLVGLCQGGWLSAIVAAMIPERVSSLTVAGAPIDTHAGKSVLHKATALPLSFFKGLVALGGGRMNGHVMLAGWKASDPIEHYWLRYFRRDPRTERFYSWYDLAQHLPGTLYLWIIDQLFQRNVLGRNTLTIAGAHVDLNGLRSVPQVNIVYGATDDITPPEQAMALMRYTEANCLEVDSGHVGLFMSRSAISGPWSQLFRGLS